MKAKNCGFFLSMVLFAGVQQAAAQPVIASFSQNGLLFCFNNLQKQYRRNMKNYINFLCLWSLRQTNMKTTKMAILLIAIVLLFKSVGNCSPQIAGVQITGSTGNYIVTVTGSGFGTLPLGLPFYGDTSYMRIGDAPQLIQGEWGYTGNSHPLTYESWTDNQVQVSGFGAQPGDAIVIALWNPSSGEGVSWGGNVPGGSVGLPQITSVAFSGSGTNLEIAVSGSGFGNAPVTMPFTGDLNFFIFSDFRTNCEGASSWSAGGSLWGTALPESVTLKYQSWSATNIVVSGFSGSYGQGCVTLQNGDPVGIYLWNSGDESQAGLQTAWGGILTGLSINMYAGLTIFAPVGSTNMIQYVNNIRSTNWTTLTNLISPANPYIFIDFSSPSQPERFYRDVIQ